MVKIGENEHVTLIVTKDGEKYIIHSTDKAKELYESKGPDRNIMILNLNKDLEFIP